MNKPLAESNNLTLKVISTPDQSSFTQSSLTITRKGATFGRKDENTHVLPDSEKIISSYHAAISLVDGKFTLTDTSTNGTMVNDVPITFPKALCHNDVITIGKYQFSVDIGNHTPNQSAPAANNDAPPSFLDELALVTPQPSNGPSVSPSEPIASDQANISDDAFEQFLAPKPLAATQAPQLQTSIDDLDQWLEPSQNLGSDSLLPLQQQSSSDQSLMGNEVIDPLIALNQASDNNKNTLSGLIGDTNEFSSNAKDTDEQWWLESGSHGDHASALNQAVSEPLVSQAQHSQAAQDTQSDSNSHPQRQPWEIEQIELNTIDDFLALKTETLTHSAPNQTAQQSQAKEHPAQQYQGHQNQEQQHQQQIQQNHPQQHQIQQNHFAQHQTQQAQIAGSPGLVQALAAELGLNRLNEQELSQLIPEVSGILKETTSRLLEVLIARSNVKNEMRLERTMIKTSENNPLKFSVSGEDALQNLLAPRSAAFLSGKAAITEAFDDLADHQIALLSGMREAYQNMLERFSPEVFSDDSQANTNVGIFKGNAKAKQWDAFTAYYKTLQSDQEATYNDLFGDKFNRAYEEKINSLKIMRKQKSPV